MCYYQQISKMLSNLHVISDYCNKAIMHLAVCFYRGNVDMGSNSSSSSVVVAVVVIVEVTW